MPWPSTSSCPKWAKASLKAPLPSGSKNRATASNAMSRCSKSLPTKWMRRSRRLRRLAKENQVDLSGVEGSGAGGRISKKDILAAMQSGTGKASAPATPAPPAAAASYAATPAAPVPAAVPAGPGGAIVHPALENAVPRERIYFGNFEAQPMVTMRQRIAEHMVASKRVSPHVYSIDEADMTRIAKIRERSKAAFEAKYGTKLTYMPFFVRACVEGLRAFPTVNASADGTTMVLHREINVGIAVALDWGLIVPVLKNSEEKNFLGLSRGIN